jgi:hypothetical protein
MMSKAVLSRDVNKTFNRKTEPRPRPSIFHIRRDPDQDLECRDRDVVRDLREFNIEEEHPKQTRPRHSKNTSRDEDVETETTSLVLRSRQASNKVIGNHMHKFATRNIAIT